MNAIPLINNVPKPNINVGSIGSPVINPIGASAKLSGNVMRQNPYGNNETQLRQEINTSLVALKKEAFSLETLIAQAAQTLQDVNKRLSELEGKQGDYVKKADATVSSVGGDGKYISAISETDGKISATATDLGNMVPVNSVTSGNMHSVTSNAVNNINYQAVKYGANYDCNTIGEGVALINGEVLNSPYKQGLTTQWIGYLFTRKIATNSEYQSQIVISYKDNELFTRTYTDNGWTSWRRITSLKEKKIRIDDSGYTLRNGVYAKEITNFFTNNGIDYSKVVNIRQVNNGNNFYPYFFISYDASDLLGVFKFANVSNTYIDIKVYYE